MAILLQSTTECDIRVVIILNTYIYAAVSPFGVSVFMFSTIPAVVHNDYNVYYAQSYICSIKWLGKMHSKIHYIYIVHIL